MEILVGLLIIGVVIALSRLWSTACEESTNNPDAAAAPPSYLTANGAPNSWLLYEARQSFNEADSPAPAAFSDQSPSDSNTQQQNCSADLGTDNSGANCSCPADSTSYDSSGCSVDLGSSGGDSN